MKKIIIFIAVILIATVSSFGQIQSVPYDSLNVNTKALFAKYGGENIYGDVIKTEMDSVGQVYLVTGIKKSRKMVSDSTGTHPEHPDQYLISYWKDGELKAFISIENPEEKATNAGVSINTYMSQTGLKQGDDDFPEASSNSKSGVVTAPNYTISSEW